VVAAILAAGVLYDDIDLPTIEQEFSSQLRAWYSHGQYFMYKNKYKIFYRLDEIQRSNAEKETTEQKEATLLFLHGFPTSSHDYQQVWNQLKNENDGNSLNREITTLLSFDYVGYGFSDKPSVDHDYSIFDMADLVDQLLVHLNISRVYVVSHDIGDTVALEMLRRDNLAKSSRNTHYSIQSLCMLNGGIFQSAYKPMLAQDILRNKFLRAKFANHLFIFPVFKYFFSLVFGSLKPPTKTEMWDFYLSVRYNDGNRVLPLTIGYMEERDQYGRVWLDALNETNVPINFVYGPADPVNLRSQFTKTIRTEMPKVKLTILSDLVGHYPHTEDPFTVTALIRNIFSN